MRQAAWKLEAHDQMAGTERHEGGRQAVGEPGQTGAAAPGFGPARAGIAASEGGCRRDQRLLDWVESQASVTRIWLDQLIAEGDPEDLVSLIHRQAAWLDLMRSRLAES